MTPAQTIAFMGAPILPSELLHGYARISKIKPLIPTSNKPKVTGPNDHPLWPNISANWVAMHGNPHTVSLCLETIWNYQNSTTDGYRAVGSNLAIATREYLAERPMKP